MNNLAKRSLSGILFLAIMVGGLMFKYGFLAIMLVIMFNASDEFIGIAGSARKTCLQGLLAKLAGATLLGICFLVCQDGISASWTALALIPVLLIPLSFIFTGKTEDTDALMPVYTSLIYICLPVSLSPFLVFRAGEYDGTLLLSLFILIWMSDVGAYCLGTLFGQKEHSAKLAPAVSPKKSWWGFWGGVFCAAAASVVVHYLLLPYVPVIHCIALGIIIPVTCVCGDLVESMWKRRFSVKDSGNSIPGHGGVLDRFDSSLAAIPFAALYLLITGII